MPQSLGYGGNRVFSGSIKVFAEVSGLYDIGRDWQNQIVIVELRI